MKVRVFGARAGYGPGEHPNRVMLSWAPNELVDVDDGDDQAVAFYQRWIDAGIAEAVDDEPSPEPVPERQPEQAPAPRVVSTPDSSKQPSRSKSDARQAVQRTGREQVRPRGAEPRS